MLLARSAIVARREIRACRDTIIPVLKTIDDLESEEVGWGCLDDAPHPTWYSKRATAGRIHRSRCYNRARR
jgi:hypothetical protein